MEDNHGRATSIAEVHRALGLPAPKHPLISLINRETSTIVRPPGSHVLHFYKISYWLNADRKVRYGQGYYDFDEGGLLFASPNQLIGSKQGDGGGDYALYTLLIHPDFLLNYSLTKKIRQYGFFAYSTNEALHLSEDERIMVLSILKMIEDELNRPIDDYSQDVAISLIELLLNHANRFYKRQFITRKSVNNEMLQKVDELLEIYFNEEKTSTHGVPSVKYLAEQLNVSPNYLSDMLRALIGQNAQQYIHYKLIEKAKEILSTTNLSVMEVAYALGFEHSQSFNKLFKARTALSPLQFRRSFN
jgi:AraC-like DNA-binding protein